MPTRRKDDLGPERGLTDGSLRSERQKVDEARKGVRDAEDEVAAVEERSVRGSGPEQRAAADEMEDALHDQANALHALDALIAHERAATDAYLLTERVRADDAVANRDEFLGMVAHDVRNLLNLVVLGLQPLRSPGDELARQQVQMAAERILRYVARMNRIVSDLVDVTSIGAGKLAVRPVRSDAARLMKEVADAFQLAAAENGIELVAAPPTAEMRALFDHERLVQVFSNLISNAIKFTPKGGRITFDANLGERSLRFCVADTGIGIPVANLEAIFDRFWKSGDDRRGQGLGLYISKSIVEAHGGRMWAESSVSLGARLYVEIPAGNRGAEAAAT
jgi:signal transduction histidine kinase